MDDLLNIEDVAQKFSVAPRTINHWVQHQQFPLPIRFGKKPYWRSADLDAYVQQRQPEQTADRPIKSHRNHSVRSHQNATELQAMLAARRAVGMQARQRYPR
jgi:predicted DNA-binding transcriptional regulator AlpA